MSGVCEETTVDWRGRPSNPSKHGGMKAATFVLGKCSIAHLHLSFFFYKCDIYYNRIMLFNRRLYDSHTIEMMWNEVIVKISLIIY